MSSISCYTYVGPIDHKDYTPLWSDLGLTHQSQKPVIAMANLALRE
jgi:hypothetical protein